VANTANGEERSRDGLFCNGKDMVRLATRYTVSAFATLVLIALSACRGSGLSAPDAGWNASQVVFSGQLGLPTPIHLNAWLPEMTVSSGSASATAVIDTGSPLVLVDSPVFGLDAGPSYVPLNAFGGTFPGLPVLAHDAAPAELSNGSPTVQLGGSLWLNFAVGIDYKASNAYLLDGGTAAVPPDISPAELATPKLVSFDLLGGGLGGYAGCTSGCLVPATRVLVPVVVEGGTPVWMMVDTGSSWVTLDAAFGATLSTNGRPRLDGIPDYEINSSEQSYLTRLASIAVGGAVDTNEPVLVLPSADDFFSGISTETGVSVVGAVGGGFLRRRVTIIDYPAKQLVLADYLDSSFIDPNEFVGVGFYLSQEGTSWVVAEVLAPSGAETAGLMVGDIVSTVDGTSLAGMDAVAVNQLLTGFSVGDVVTVTVERSSQTLDLKITVENLLPDYFGP
jgi:hypothetical protein